MKKIGGLKPRGISEFIRTTITLVSISIIIIVFLRILKIEDGLIEILSWISFGTCAIFSALGGVFASVLIISRSIKWKKNDLEVFSSLRNQNFLRYVVTWGLTSAFVGGIVGLVIFPGIVVLYGLVVPILPILAFVFLYFVLIMFPFGFLIVSFATGFIIVIAMEKVILKELPRQS